MITQFLRIGSMLLIIQELTKTQEPSQTHIETPLGKLCLEVGIKQVFASVEHPQTNGQVESANRVLLGGLKRRLEKAKETWAEEVLRIVLAYHTTPQSITRETPFSLVYGSDAMIPVEIQESSPHF